MAVRNVETTWLRRLSAIMASAAMGFTIPLVVILAAAATGAIDFEGPYTAGNERVATVGATAVMWYFALAAPVAVVVAGRRFTAMRFRLILAATAVAACAAAAPLITTVTGTSQPDEVALAAWAGLGLGVITAATVARFPTAGLGIGLHALALTLTGLVSGALYAGAAGSLPHQGPPVNTALLVVVGLSALGAGLLARRTGRRLNGWVFGCAGPVLAWMIYVVSPHGQILWDEEAGILALVTMILAVAASAGTAWVGASRHDT